MPGLATAVPRVPAQAMENLNLCLKALTEPPPLGKGIKLVNIGAEDLAGTGSEHEQRTLVLGLTWELIKFYELGGRSSVGMMSYLNGCEQRSRGLTVAYQLVRQQPHGRAHFVMAGRSPQCKSPASHSFRSLHSLNPRVCSLICAGHTDDSNDPTPDLATDCMSAFPPA